MNYYFPQKKSIKDKSPRAFLGFRRMVLWMALISLFE